VHIPKAPKTPKAAPLAPMGLFVTPSSQNELTAYLEAHFDGSERASAMVLMGMTWNYAASLAGKRGRS
jgi:hypothetical protein